MRYFLITTGRRGPSRNVGCAVIADGLRYLIRQADPHAIFHVVDQDVHRPQDWEYMQAVGGCLVFAGNPRLNSVAGSNQHCDRDIWGHIAAARDAGLRTADLSVGATYYLPLQALDTMAAEMLALPKVLETLAHEAAMDLVITRDPLMQALVSTVRDDAALLPCASWWAKDYRGVHWQPKRRHAIAIKRLPGHEWILKAIRGTLERLSADRETLLVGHDADDYRWLAAHAPDLASRMDVYSEVRGLLGCYAETSRLVSFRLHATIPALSLGARVTHIALDSRHLCLEPWGIASQIFEALLERDEIELRDDRPEGGFNPEAAEAAYVRLLRSHLLEAR